MVGKANFTADEWSQIVRSVMTAGLAVSAAEPSGLFGMLKEGMASARTLLEAKSNPSTDELIKAVVADLETSDGRTAARDGLKSLFEGSKPAEIKSKSIATLRQVSTVLDQKAPADSVAFKSWLLHIAQSVAESSKEGGFLGFGGVVVSEAEKATVADISTALGIPATT
jgi:hypothetical protein